MSPIDANYMGQTSYVGADDSVRPLMSRGMYSIDSLAARIQNDVKYVKWHIITEYKGMIILWKIMQVFT